jgi:hypothetical protein
MGVQTDEPVDGELGHGDGQPSIGSDTDRRTRSVRREGCAHQDRGGGGRSDGGRARASRLGRPTAK